LAELEKEEGEVWNSLTLNFNFDVEAFDADHHRVFVTRWADGVKGTVRYQDNPRFYWGFEPRS
jgi:hypothetical protein